jgi:hypothetical protein
VVRFRHVQRTTQLPGIGIEQQLVVIETMAFQRFVGTGHAIPVELPGLHVGQIGVPDQVRILRHDKARDLTRSVVIEETELDFLRVFGKEGKVDTATVPARA